MDTTSDRFFDINGNVICQCCGKTFKNLGMHLKCEHGISKADYLSQYPGAPMMAASTRKASGQKGADTKATIEALYNAKRNGESDAPTVVDRTPTAASAVAVAASVPAPTSALSREVSAAHGDIVPVDPTETDVVLKFKSQSLKVLADESHPYITPHNENYVLDPADPRYEILAYCINARQPVLLVGDTGCGKSTIVEELASMINQPTRRMSLANDTDGSKFVGEEGITVQDGAPVTYFKPGLLVKCMREGSWLIIDELDGACAGAVLALQMVLNDGYLTIPETGEVVVPHKRFRLIATANTVGKGEGAGLYPGTNLLNEASLDRFVIVRCSYPRRAIEVEICKRYGVEEALADKLVEVASAVREAFDRGEVVSTFSTRKLIAWSKAITGLRDMRIATRIAVLDRLVDDREIVDGIVSRIIPMDSVK